LFALAAFFYCKQAVAQDIGVYKITAPVSSCSRLSNANAVKAIIVNHGTKTLDTIPIAYRVNSGVTVFDTIKKTIFPGDSLTFTFKEASDLSTSNLYTVRVFTALGSDVNRANDTVTKHIFSAGAPIASFTVAPACIGTPSVFIDSSYTPVGKIVKWIWAFGDRDSTFNQTASHIYSTTGNFRAELIITTDSGCTSVAYDSVMVLPAPKAVFFAPSRICEGATVSFLDSSLGNNLTYSWSFGDSATSTSASPDHVFTRSGKFLVQLTVTSKSGCQSSKTFTIQVNPAPLVSFNYSNTCSGDSARFTDLSTISDSSLLTYNWSFGDSTASNTRNPVHLYKKTGIYSVTETASSQSGCVNSETQQVIISPLPSAGFTEVLNNSTTVSFMAKDTAKGNTYAWVFGDATAVDTGANPSHTYAHQGMYVVTLAVTGGHKCFATSSDTIHVTSTGFEAKAPLYNTIDIYPNPFRGATNVSYSLTETGIVNLSVYDETGKLVTTFTNGIQVPGNYQYIFNSSGNAMPGLYLIKLSVDGNMTTKRIMEVK